MSKITNEVVIGHSVITKGCAVSALKKIRETTCITLTIRMEGEKGTFVVCKGRLIRGEWKGLKDEEAWQKMLKDVGEASNDTLISINFYPPPEEIGIVDEMSADALASEEVGSEYVASVSILALGKVVLGIIHRVMAMGITFEDIKITASEGRVIVIIINPEPRPSIDVLRNIASEYLSSVGIKDVEVRIA